MKGEYTLANNGLTKVFKNLQTTVKKHQPEILTGLGVAGFVTTTVMAVKATPKALEVLAEIKEKHADDSDKKEYCKEFVKKVVPLYIPSAVVGGLSIGCVVCANSINTKRNAALAAAYTLSETALSEYKEKVVETIGEKKEKAVREAVAQGRVDKTPVENKEVINTGDGDELCLDYHSGRYFKSTIDKLRKAENDLNRRMLLDSYVSLNDFYSEIGLSGTRQGELLGWNIEKGYLKLELDATIVDDKPCIVLDYRVSPYYDYNKFM